MAFYCKRNIVSHNIEFEIATITIVGLHAVREPATSDFQFKLWATGSQELFSFKELGQEVTSYDIVQHNFLGSCKASPENHLDVTQCLPYPFTTYQ